jgi:hypothetical protein
MAHGPKHPWVRKQNRALTWVPHFTFMGATLTITWVPHGCHIMHGCPVHNYTIVRCPTLVVRSTNVNVAPFWHPFRFWVPGPTLWALSRPYTGGRAKCQNCRPWHPICPPTSPDLPQLRSQALQSVPGKTGYGDELRFLSQHSLGVPPSSKS